MYFKKSNLENIQNNIDVASKILYKVSYNTLKTADKAISHIKKNKKTYKQIVFLFALALTPQYLNAGIDFLSYLIVEIANCYVRLSLDSFLKIMAYSIAELLSMVCYYAIAFLAAKDIIKTGYNFALNKFGIK